MKSAARYWVNGGIGKRKMKSHWTDITQKLNYISSELKIIEPTTQSDINFERFMSFDKTKTFFVIYLPVQDKQRSWNTFSNEQGTII